jgi:hypothetical protein
MADSSFVQRLLATVMEREQQKYLWQRGNFPQPARVVQAALELIQPDGSVIFHDEESSFVWKASKPIPLQDLPHDVYEVHLLDVARSVAGSCLNIARMPDEAEWLLEPLAVFLSSYRHDPRFLQEALALCHVDEKGRLHHPRLSLSDKVTER